MNVEALGAFSRQLLQYKANERKHGERDMRSPWLDEPCWHFSLTSKRNTGERGLIFDCCGRSPLLDQRGDVWSLSWESTSRRSDENMEDHIAKSSPLEWKRCEIQLWQRKSLLCSSHVRTETAHGYLSASTTLSPIASPPQTSHYCTLSLQYSLGTLEGQKGQMVLSPQTVGQNMNLNRGLNCGLKCSRPSWQHTQAGSLLHQESEVGGGGGG